MDHLIQIIAIWALPVIFAITLHEAAHGYVAKYFGDTTAYMLGRVSLNPVRHIDPVGTILVPLIILAVSSNVGAGPILFGWAKPVPVNFSALNHPKRDMLWVAAAGPAANLVMALGWALLAKLGLMMPESSFAEPMVLMAAAGISINLVLMLLNLLPIPPLDGGRIAVSLLPRNLAMQYAKLEPWGFPILIILLFTNVLSQVLHPLLGASQNMIATLFQLHN